MTTAVAKFIIRHYMKAQASASKGILLKHAPSVKKIFSQHGGQYKAFMKAKAHLIHNKRVKAGTYKWSDGNKSWKSSSGEGRENYRASQAKTGPLVGRARYGLDK